MKTIKTIFNILLVGVPLVTFFVGIIYLDSAIKFSNEIDDIFGSTMDAYIVFLFLFPTLLAEIDLIYNIKNLIVNHNGLIWKIARIIRILLSLLILFLVVCCFSSLTQYLNISTIDVLNFITVWTVLYIVFIIFKCIKVFVIKF